MMPVTFDPINVHTLIPSGTTPIPALNKTFVQMIASALLSRPLARLAASSNFACSSWFIFLPAFTYILMLLMAAPDERAERVVGVSYYLRGRVFQPRGRSRSNHFDKCGG